MNRKLKHSLAFVTLFAVALVAMLPVAGNASTISSGGALLGQNSIPAPGGDGYVLYQAEATPPANGGGGGAGVDTGTLPSYVSVSTAGDSFFASGSGYPYSTLTASGTAYKTGIAYQFPGNGNYATLATITLQAGVPSSFQLGVLTNNTDNLQNTASAVTVTSVGLGGNAITQNTTAEFSSNDFYLFNVTGASAGDVITVALQQSGGAADPLGGLTFNSVPEPSTVVLFGLGAIGLLLAARRRRAR